MEHYPKVLENEADLIEKAKKDDSSFAVLYDFYFPKIYGYIYKRTGSRETAEDLVSITFMSVFTNLHKYNHEGYTFGAWVYKIATNNLIDHYRKQAKRKNVDIENITEPAADQDLPADYAEVQQNRQTVLLILPKLNKKYQKILHYRFFAELETREIASAMSISENNCRVLLHRALKSFDKHYSESGNRSS
jgi:RNA polymerase sigma-70 factor, ECF subfamily